MSSALRRLGIFLFCLGGIVVVVALVPILAAWLRPRQEQVAWAGVMVGGLMAVSGLVADWLGSAALRDEAQKAQPPVRPLRAAGEQDDPAGVLPQPPPGPPPMRLSASPKSGSGYREDLMA